MGDAIDDLVDWQLSRRQPKEIIWDVCRICTHAWHSVVAIPCPRCGTVQQCPLF